MKAIKTVTGTVITNKNAAAYVARMIKTAYAALDQHWSIVLDQIETEVVSAGFLTWEQIEALEVEILKAA